MNSPIVKEVLLNAPIQKVWQSLTDKEIMKQWYFDIANFKPEVGHEFEFLGGEEGKQYLHLCKVLEVVEGKKISYSWRYDNNPGNSIVTFELSEAGDQTRIKLTHEGLESFGTDNPDLARENFVMGWEQIIGTSIKKFLENE